jgi:hypothetical protein
MVLFSNLLLIDNLANSRIGGLQLWRQRGHLNPDHPVDSLN